MHQYEREFLITRICAGYLRYKLPNYTLKIVSPNKDLRYEAQEIYIETYQNALYEGVLDDRQVYDILLANGFWSEDEQKLIDSIIPNVMENLKVKMYEINLHTEKVVEMRKELRRLEARFFELMNKRHSLDYISCHGVATYHKLNFIAENSVYYIDGTKYDWKDCNLSDVLEFTSKNTISDSDFRMLAKTQPWQNLWLTGKKNGSVFSGSIGDLTDDQQKLISWSCLYDNISECPEAPQDNIVDDDDLLDGWLILQKRNREQEQGKKAGENFIAANEKIANSKEVYMMVGNEDYQVPKDKVHLIEGMNSPTAKFQKQQRMNTVKNKGTALDTDFQDVRLELQRQSNEKFMGTARGK